MSNAYTPRPAPSGLDPAMLTQLLQYLIMGGGDTGQLPDVSQLSLGFDPTGMQGLTLPQMPGTSSSRAVGSVEELGKQENALQDMADLAGLGDYGMAGMFGPGSFSADAFAPTVTSELIPQPEAQRLEGWLQDPTSFEGWVATRVRQGKSPRAAVVEMRQAYERGTAEDANPEQQADAERIRLLLAPGYPEEDEFGNPIADAGPPGPNWTRAFDAADKLVEPYLEEQRTLPPIGTTGDVRDADGNLLSSGGEIVQGDDGQLYRVTSEDSPLAQEYREMGLPLPTDEYTPGDLLGADWQQADQAFQDAQPGVQEQLDQMQADADRASAGAVAFGEMPLQDFYDRASVPGSLAAQTGAIPALPGTGAADRAGDLPFNESATITQASPLAPVVDTNTGIVTDSNNPWPGLDPTMIAAEEAQRLRLEQERIAQEENPQLGGDWWSMALSNVTGGNRPAGAPQASTPIVTGGSTTPLDYTIDPVTGQPVLTHGPSGNDAMWSLLNRMPAGDQPEPPTPGTVDWSQAISGGQYNQPGAMGPPTPSGTVPMQPLSQGNFLAQGGQPQQPDLAQILLALGQQHSNTSTRTGAEPSEAAAGLPNWSGVNVQRQALQAALAGGAASSGLGIVPGPNDANTLAQGPRPRRPNNTSTRTGAEPSEGVRPTNPVTQALIQQLLSVSGNTLAQAPQVQRAANMSQRTGPEPSETAGRNTSTRTGPEPSENVRRRSGNASQRTGPEPSEQQQAVLRFMLGGGDANTLAQAGPNRTDRNRFTLGGGIDSNTLAQGGRQGGGGGKNYVPSTGFNRQGMAVLHANTDSRNALIARSALQDRQTVAANRLRGRDYYRALGYTRAMRDLGITPYSSATANRTGGVNAILGRG